MDECSKIHTGIWDLDFYKTNALFCHHYKPKADSLCARLGGKLNEVGGKLIVAGDKKGPADYKVTSGDPPSRFAAPA
jgi:hypothetical protein